MGSIPIARSNSLGYRHESPGMTRFMNSSNMGTVKAVSPRLGLHTIPFAISELRVGASDETAAISIFVKLSNFDNIRNLCIFAEVRGDRDRHSGKWRPGFGTGFPVSAQMQKNSHDRPLLGLEFAPRLRSFPGNS